MSGWLTEDIMDLFGIIDPHNPRARRALKSGKGESKLSLIGNAMSPLKRTSDMV